MATYRVERWNGSTWERRAITDQLSEIEATHVVEGIEAAGGAARLVDETHGRAHAHNR